MIERLGRTTLNLFDDSAILNEKRASLGVPSNRFGEIDQEYMEWFGMKDHVGSMPDEFPDTIPKSRFSTDAEQLASQSLMQDQAFNGMMDMEGLFDLSFDMSLPLMTEDSFGQGGYSI